jgi:ferredoxin-nitrate reductase
MTRDSIEDIWGERTPYKHEWPTRVDERVMEEPDKWVQSACVLCRYEGLQRLIAYSKHLN